MARESFLYEKLHQKGILSEEEITDISKKSMSDFAEAGESDLAHAMARLSLKLMNKLIEAAGREDHKQINK
ncbi:MAG: hypothetical protein V1806_05815 [Pseudomonadota bacterium]